MILIITPFQAFYGREVKGGKSDTFFLHYDDKKRSILKWKNLYAHKTKKL